MRLLMARDHVRRLGEWAGDRRGENRCDSVPHNGGTVAFAAAAVDDTIASAPAAAAIASAAAAARDTCRPGSIKLRADLSTVEDEAACIGHLAPGDHHGAMRRKERE